MHLDAEMGPGQCSRILRLQLSYSTVKVTPSGVRHLKMLGTIVLWGVSVVALIVTLAGGALFYFTASASPYPESWIASVSVVAGFLFALWTNPLCRYLLRQRGRLLGGWLVALGLLILIPLGMFAENYFRSNSPRALVAEGDVLKTDNPSRAANLYARACSANYGPGCTQLGHIHDPGPYTGPLPDASASREAYQRACDLGDASGCVGLAMRVGEESPDDSARAQELYLRSCELRTEGWGNDIGASMCTSAGEALLRGEAGPRDLERAQRYFERACPQNGPPGFERATTECRRASEHLEKISLEVANTDLSRATDIAGTALRQAQLGCEESSGVFRSLNCGAYGRILSRGVVLGSVVLLAPNVAQGVPILLETCHGGDIEACSLYERLPREGHRASVAQDESSCDRNYADACVDLGRLYDFGVDVAPDRSRAMLYYARACQLIEQGSAPLYVGDECYQAAMLAYEGSETTPPNLVEARRHLTNICSSDGLTSQIACVQLGDMLREGRGGPTNPAGAIAAYNRAIRFDPELVFAEIARGKLRLVSPAN